jgi:glycosyltransferase involved in cell wall biosynthesis
LLASEFARRGIRTSILSVAGASPTDYSVASTVKILRLGRPKVAPAFGELQKAIRTLRPTWVVSGSLNTDLAVLSLRSILKNGTRILCSFQNNLSKLLESEHFVGKRLLLRLAIKLYRSADVLTAISRGVAADATRHVGGRSPTCAVVPNPLDLPAIARLRAQPSPEVTVPSSAPWILAAGRLTEQKDFSTLLRAFSLVRTHRPEVRLVILGDGPQRPHLERLTIELGLGDAVQFPGFVRNPFGAMARARVFVLSSRYEGFGNVVAEALACGAEVVSTDCPFGPREILAEGRFGWLVPVGDPPAMARAILEALQHRRNDPELVQRWLHQFSLPEVAGSYLRLMQGEPRCA